MKDYDVFGIGAITVDLIGKSAYWPSSGEKVRLDSFDIYDGGLTGTALVTVSRLGGKAAIAAKLGNSFWSQKSIEALKKEGVDISNIIRSEGSEPVISMIISNQEDLERNIFFSRKGVSYPFPDELSDQHWYEHTRVLLIDHGTGKAGVKAASLAAEHGVEVVIDAERIEPHLEEMFDFCDHIVVSQDFARMYAGNDQLEKAIYSLRKKPEQHIVVTRGSRGLMGLYADKLFEVPGHSIKVVDTTGCGDVFHGAYALAIARGRSVRDAAEYANAAAALAATRTGGREGIPSSGELARFMSL
jgi:ribokinase